MIDFKNGVFSKLKQTQAVPDLGTAFPQGSDV